MTHAEIKGAVSHFRGPSSDGRPNLLVRGASECAGVGGKKRMAKLAQPDWMSEAMMLKYQSTPTPVNIRKENSRMNLSKGFAS